MVEFVVYDCERVTCCVWLVVFISGWVLAFAVGLVGWLLACELALFDCGLGWWFLVCCLRVCGCMCLVYAWLVCLVCWWVC